jgi:hypothetical protein
MHYEPIAKTPRQIPALDLVEATVRKSNERLIALLSKPEPLSAEEWRWIEAVTD